MTSPTAPAPGSVALITGGTGGFGRALATKLRERDITAVLADLDTERNRSVAEELGCPFAALDVTDRVAVDEAVTAASSQHGPAFDLLVSNAGTDRGADLVDVDDDQWRGVFAVNVHGPMYLARAFVRHLQQVEKRRRPGDIVCVVSISALTVGAGAGAYNASKAAMLKLAEVMQTEARERGWPARVCALNPAAMNTPMMDQWQLPQERMMDPAIVAGLIRTAVTLPPEVVLQSLVVTLRNEYYPR